MYIKELECPQCNEKGRPGSGSFILDSIGSHNTCFCNRCNNSVNDPFMNDQMIFSGNPFVRLKGLSDYVEAGYIFVTPGEIGKIRFKQEIDLVCHTYYNVYSTPLAIQEQDITTFGLTLLTSRFPYVDYESVAGPVEIYYTIYGIKSLKNMPVWYMQFYSGVSHLEKSNFKMALFDFAVSFESFIKSYLINGLSRKYNHKVATEIMNKNWMISAQCCKVLKILTGHSLDEFPDIYTNWQNDVQTLRNKLFHGHPLIVGKENAESALAAVYQAVRFIERELSAN